MKKLLSILMIVFLSINILGANHIGATIDEEGQVVNQEENYQEPELVVEFEEENEEEVPVLQEENEEEVLEELEPEALVSELENEEETESVEELAEEEILDESENLIDEEIETEDQPIVGAVLGAPAPEGEDESEDTFLLGDLDQYFYIEDDEIIFDGEYHTPSVSRNGYGPDFEYRVDLTWVTEADHILTPLIFGARDTGDYILHATISYTNAKTLIGEILFTFVQTVRIPFSINKGVIETDIEVETLYYNGEVQYPKLYVGGVELVQNRDFVVNPPTIQSKDANAVDGELIAEKEPYTTEISLINYVFDDESSTKTIEYLINKRPLTITSEYTDEYDPNGLLPDISATDSYGNSISLELGSDYAIESITSYGGHTYEAQADGTYVLYPNTFLEWHNPYDVEVKFSDDFLANNIVDTTDVTYTITKAKLNLDFDALYYNGENQKPTFYERDGKIDNIAQYLVMSEPPFAEDGSPLYNYSEVGSYYLHVWINPIYAHDFRYYEWDDGSPCFNEEIPGVLTVGYRINKRVVEFAGWRLDNELGYGTEVMHATLGTIEADFIWTVDADGNASLEYNGFNPFLFQMSNGKSPIPSANYVWYNDEGEAISIYDIARFDCTYLPLIPSEALKISVGTYYVNIFVTEDDCYAARNEKATFKVTPKPVQIVWTETIIDVNDCDKDPRYEIVGLAPIDKLGFKFTRTEDGINWETTDVVEAKFIYYDVDEAGNLYYIGEGPCAQPQEEGRYAVEALNVVFKIAGIVDPNYYLDDSYITSYVIVDKSSVHDNGTIHVGTINEVPTDEVSKLDLVAPNETEMAAVIAKLETTDPEAYEALSSALANGKDINVYVVATPVDPEEEGLYLPTQNCVVIDLELYAFVQGETKAYQIHETGTYNVGVEVTLTPQQAADLGYGEGRCFYIARYHNSLTPTYTQMVSPTVDADGNYVFRLSSNQFSDFAIYTGPKPNDIPYNPDHVVPYTQA